MLFLSFSELFHQSILWCFANISLFNFFLKNPEVNWLKYQLSFWKWNKSSLQMVFCTEFCKILHFLLIPVQFPKSYPRNFQNKCFFPNLIMASSLDQPETGWLETSFQQEFIINNHLRFNVHAPSIFHQPSSVGRKISPKAKWVLQLLLTSHLLQLLKVIFVYI